MGGSARHGAVGQRQPIATYAPPTRSATESPITVAAGTRRLTRRHLLMGPSSRCAAARACPVRRPVNEPWRLARPDAGPDPPGTRDRAMVAAATSRALLTRNAMR